MRAHRMLWMLEEMGLEDEIRPLDFARRHDDAEFLEASPTGSTPAIDDGEVRVFESCAILEHLGAKHGPYSRPPPPTPSPLWRGLAGCSLEAYMGRAVFGRSRFLPARPRLRPGTSLTLASP